MESIYLEEETEGQMKERRGRACSAGETRKGRPPKLDKTEIEYLKKLDALVQKRLQEGSKRNESGTIPNSFTNSLIFDFA